MDYSQFFSTALNRLHDERRYRVFADLERQGLIRRRGREIQFTDMSEFRRVASFQPNYLD